jgi:hypothetical protein
MKKILGIALLFSLSATLVGCELGESESTVRDSASSNISFEYVNRDKVDSTTTIITVKHKETGCYYAALSSKQSASGVGGISPLYEKDGRPLCSK